MSIRSLALLCGLLIGNTAANAAIIERSTTLSFTTDQLFDQGEYGSGTFWRPEFQLDPFTVSGAGDQIGLTVHLSGGRLVVFGGVNEQEAVGASLFSLSASGVTTTYYATFEFLGIQGDLISPTGSSNSLSGPGNGIAANFNPTDLTDTSFSFDGLRIVFSIANSPLLTGFPVEFDSGMVAVQTQGRFAFLAIPEPSSLLLSIALLLIGSLVAQRR